MKADKFDNILNRDSNEVALVNKIRDLKSQKQTYSKLYFNSALQLFSNKFKYLMLFRKKTILKRIISICLIVACILPSLYLIKNPNIVVLPGKNSKEFVYVDNSSKSNKEFLNDLGFFESSGNYNPSGNASYWGKYQIGRAALDAIGFDQISKEEFIKDTLLQEVAIRRLMKFNKKVLSELIGKYEGKTIAGVYVTQSGLLAAAHLGGCNSVKLFLESEGANIFRDGNGTPITKYMKHFTGYKLKF